MKQALRLLAEVLGAGQLLQARVEHAGLVAELTVRPAGLRVVKEERAEQPAASSGGKEFSPIEAAILKVMEEADGWITKTQIAGACGQGVSSWFSYALANLVDREYLDSGRNGYRKRKSAQVPQPSESAQPTEQRGREFSPIEESILAVATREWQTAQQFAEPTGQKVSHAFYSILGNLVDRDYLESGSRGYRKQENAT